MKYGRLVWIPVTSEAGGAHSRPPLPIASYDAVFPRCELCADMRELKIRPMTLNTELPAQVERLLSSERARPGPWYRSKRVDLPKWFIDAPDGLDIEQKRDLFDKTVANVNRVLAAVMICLAGTLPPAAIALAKHHWTAAAVTLLLTLFAYGVFIPLLRRKLIDRQLRGHSQL